MAEPGPPGADVECACGERFRVLSSLRNGLVNCPRCRRVAQVKGRPEALFWLALSAGAVLAVAVTAAAFALAGPSWGWTAAGVAAAALLVAVLAS